MAHITALNTLLNTGLRQNELQNVLASNVVLDWFGRTVSGQQKVVNFYLNSNNQYEHHMTNTESTQSFEDRSTHNQTRKEPPENFIKPVELNGNEQWFDCETHSPIDLKEALKTPPKRLSSTFVQCPPAPNRRSFFNQAVDEKDSSSDLDSDSDDDVVMISGIRPLDSPFGITSTKSEQKRDSKRLKIDKHEKEIFDEGLVSESKYSDLYYLESSGVVHIARQASTSTPSTAEESDRREIKLLISYRVNKENSNDIQIALIVYKSNNSNVKSRRNLMLEFGDMKDSDSSSIQATPPSITTSTISRCSTVGAKEPETSSNLPHEITTAPQPAGHKVTKGTKRPMMSRHCLRF